MSGELAKLARTLSAFAADTVSLLLGANSTDDDNRDVERPLLDSNLIGEFNHRTRQLDAGNDPYGWYDES